MLRAQSTRSNHNFAITESIYFVGSSPRVNRGSSPRVNRGDYAPYRLCCYLYAMFDVPAWAFLDLYRFHLLQRSHVSWGFDENDLCFVLFFMVLWLSSIAALACSLKLRWNHYRISHTPPSFLSGLLTVFSDIFWNRGLWCEELENFSGSWINRMLA
jgi:hypothetical protein